MATSSTRPAARAGAVPRRASRMIRFLNATFASLSHRIAERSTLLGAQRYPYDTVCDAKKQPQFPSSWDGSRPKSDGPRLTQHTARHVVPGGVREISLSDTRDQTGARVPAKINQASTVLAVRLRTM